MRTPDELAVVRSSENLVLALRGGLEPRSPCLGKVADKLQHSEAIVARMDQGEEGYLSWWGLLWTPRVDRTSAKGLKLHTLIRQHAARSGKCQ
jgi:hypothetical protein